MATTLLERRQTAGDLLFWTAAAVLLFWGLGDRGLWTAEGRWAEIVREMFRSGDYFHPTINGAAYFDKPLLTYWLIAAAAKVLGALDELALRLPSAAAGLAALWGLRDMGARLFSPGVGRAAGWMLLTSYGFLFWARAGTADMENLAAVTLAVAWYLAHRERPGFWNYLAFWLICFVGAETKGLTAVVVPVLAVAADLYLRRDWSALRDPRNIAAALLAAGVYLVPFVYAGLTRPGYEESGLALVFRENVQRFFQPFDHKEPFYVYLYYLPMLLLPWAPLFLASLAGAPRWWRGVRDGASRAAPETWVFLALVLVFCFFTASGSRRSYYILPALPFAALWMAAGFEHPAAVFGRWAGAALRVQGGFLALAGLAALAAAAATPLWERRLGFVPPPGLAALVAGMGLAAAAAGAAAAFSSRRLGPGGRARAAVAAAAVLMGGYFLGCLGLLEPYRTEKPFALALKRELAATPGARAAFYRKASPNTIFYLDPPADIPVLADAAAVRAFQEGPGVPVLVSRRKYLAELAPLGLDPAAASLAEPVRPWEGRARRKLVAWRLRAGGGR
ncbi:hypothetical protein G3N55_08800 [Dissulfurirhabdus thermomarina]|uniref:Glycosyltransferase RgtA/B/C/D-like domain-containing protein n=1 Tax=Dissulfurirhabdus thermomarina TaxID=1765737 RepID=A0A6N9TPG3_DISTH|nr:glycosyltransferase family 39 protein [Dissulfurirhabdus thermomarina]NDY42938.1 hypothetical protein [Dissulfurirhabdus thermomarina]NMX22899.1 hypothetical protein [Dissulfurirhabdus thermomarina]